MWEKFDLDSCLLICLAHSRVFLRLAFVEMTLGKSPLVLP